MKVILGKELIYFHNGYFVKRDMKICEEDFPSHIEAQENNKFYAQKKKSYLSM